MDIKIDRIYVHNTKIIFLYVYSVTNLKKTVDIYMKFKKKLLSGISTGDITVKCPYLDYFVEHEGKKIFSDLHSYRKISLDSSRNIEITHDYNHSVSVLGAHTFIAKTLMGIFKEQEGETDE